VGLSAGEPPATKGYPPSVFAQLPRLLERAGRFGEGLDHRLLHVLVEGDDANEPIADAARSILDGHVWLSRDLAVRGHYPAIDPLQSVSRLLNDVVAARAGRGGDAASARFSRPTATRRT
jgi:flagellum-specific ATP synthase